MKEPKQAPIKDLSELRSYFQSHNVIREYIAHTSKVHSVGWSCDGRKLASGSFDKSVAIFNLERNRLVSLFKIIKLCSQKIWGYVCLFLCLQGKGDYWTAYFILML